MRPLGWPIAAILAAGLFVSWCHDRGQSAERLAAIARADALQARSDSLTATHVTDSTAAAERVAHLADSLRALDRKLLYSTKTAADLGRAILAMTDTGPVPRAQVIAALNAKDAVIVQQDEKIRTLEADTTAWRIRWVQASREGQSWHQIALDAQTQLAAANKRSGPSRFGCTIGAGAVLTVIGSGGFGGGIMCGLHVGLHL